VSGGGSCSSSFLSSGCFRKNSKNRRVMPVQETLFGHSLAWSLDQCCQ
jgi:hypothetical protein